MIELVWDDGFIRAVKKWQKKHPELVGRFEERLRLFAVEPFHPSLKTHGLSGSLNAYSAFSITYEHRLVFRFISDNKALLVAIGRTMMCIDIKPKSKR